MGPHALGPLARLLPRPSRRTTGQGGHSSTKMLHRRSRPRSAAIVVDRKNAAGRQRAAGRTTLRQGHRKTDRGGGGGQPTRTNKRRYCWTGRRRRYDPSIRSHVRRTGHQILGPCRACQATEHTCLSRLLARLLTPLRFSWPDGTWRLFRPRGRGVEGIGFGPGSVADEPWSWPLRASGLN